MNRRLSGTLGVIAALVFTVGSCKKSPLGSLDGKPAAIVTQFSQVHVAVGGSTTFTASVVDGTLTPLPVAMTFSASAATITVADDATYKPVPPTSQRASVSAVSAGSAYVIIVGGALRDSVKVISP